jgi:hypothetical protein
MKQGSDAVYKRGSRSDAGGGLPLGYCLVPVQMDGGSGVE